MAFTSIETLALVILVLSLIKILVVVRNPMTWFNKVVKPVYSNAFWLQTIGLILAIGSLYHLLQVFSIVEIFAVMFFFAAITMMGVAPFNKELLKFATIVYKQKGIIKRVWLSTLIWTVLILWALYELFFL